MVLCKVLYRKAPAEQIAENADVFRDA